MGEHGKVPTTPRSPRVFVSYAHESDEHAEAVRDLWLFLRRCGIDARLDRTAAGRVDWALWMGEQVHEADHVLVVASASYRRAAEGRTGPDERRGVQWEARLIRDACYADQHRLDRWLPVLLPGATKDDVPDFLTPATTTVYRVPTNTLTGADALLRVLTGQPAEVEPPLGSIPVLPSRADSPIEALPAVRHEVTIEIVPDDGGVTTTTSVAGTELAERTAPLPAGLGGCWVNLTTPSAPGRLAGLGLGLWRALLDETTAARLVSATSTWSMPPRCGSSRWRPLTRSAARWPPSSSTCCTSPRTGRRPGWSWRTRTAGPNPSTRTALSPPSAPAATRCRWWCWQAARAPPPGPRGSRRR